MIDVKEVRLGNWLNWDSGATSPDYHGKVSVDDFNNLSEPTIVAASPIPITPEILEKSGFEKLEATNGGKVQKSFRISLPNGDGFLLQFSFFDVAQKWNEFKIIGNGAYDDLGEMSILIVCQHIHQLQNLYFALTGKELEINL